MNTILFASVRREHLCFKQSISSHSDRGGTVSYDRKVSEIHRSSRWSCPHMFGHICRLLIGCTEMNLI